MKHIRLTIFVIINILLWALLSGSSSIAQNESGNDKINNLISDFDKEFNKYLQEAVEITGKEIIRLEPINSLNNKMVISGSHFDYGFLIGTIWNKKFDTLEINNPQEKEALSTQMIKLYEEIYPQHLELLEGIAAASGLKLNDLDMGYMEYMYFTALGWLSFKYPEFKDLLHFSKDWQITPDHARARAQHKSAVRFLPRRGCAPLVLRQIDPNEPARAISHARPQHLGACGIPLARLRGRSRGLGKRALWWGDFLPSEPYS